jgi:hypothetical protein
MARKADQEVEEQEEEGAEEEDEEQDYEEQQNGTSINIAEDSISIEVPRDGNEAETLSRLAKLVDGLGQ